MSRIYGPVVARLKTRANAEDLARGITTYIRPLAEDLLAVQLLSHDYAPSTANAEVLTGILTELDTIATRLQDIAKNA
jgi:hypothetical protein